MFVFVAAVVFAVLVIVVPVVLVVIVVLVDSVVVCQTRDTRTVLGTQTVSE